MSALVPGTAVGVATGTAAENLDDRIERIRRRNEELEQKHREAEADRLAALKNNAMVVTTRPTIGGTIDVYDDDDDDDWPRAHRYDTFAFDYEKATADAAAAVESPCADPIDLNAADAAVAANSEVKAKGPGGRDYKKFAEGQGPPPDPTFNFLADAERDGRHRRNAATAPTDAGLSSTANAANERSSKDWRSQAQGDEQQRSRGGLNGSFRAAGGQQRVGANNNNTGGRSGRGNAARTPTGTIVDDQQWKTERERIDEARIGRQMKGDGKWHREWDNEKSASAKGGLPMAALAGQMDNMQILAEQPVTTSAAGRRIVNNQNVNNNAMERRGNLTVSLSKDGEVKSVKLQPNRIIGSGRVGTRQLPANFPIDATSSIPVTHIVSPQSSQLTQMQPATMPPKPHPYYHQNNKPLLSQHQPAKPQPVYIQPTPTVYFDITQAPPKPAVQLLPLSVSDVPAATRQFIDARPKLQDRLARHRQPPTADTTG